MPVKDGVEIKAIALMSPNGVKHLVPALPVPEKPGMLKSMPGHLFSGKCCNVKGGKINGEDVVIHDIIH